VELVCFYVSGKAMSFVSEGFLFGIIFVFLFLNRLKLKVLLLCTAFSENVVLKAMFFKDQFHTWPGLIFVRNFRLRVF